MSEEVSVGKIIFIALKCFLLFVLLCCGIRAHCKREQNADKRIIYLLVFYLAVIVLIFFFELIWEYIPIIYIIMISTSAS